MQIYRNKVYFYLIDIVNISQNDIFNEMAALIVSAIPCFLGELSKPHP